MVEWLVGSATVLMMIACPCAIGWILDVIVNQFISKNDLASMPWLDRWFLGNGVIGLIGLCAGVPVLLGTMVLRLVNGG